MKVHDWSLFFLANGIATIPIRFMDKRPKLKSWEKYKTTLPNITELSTWFTGGTFHNYGVVMGWSNLAVFDFDDMGSFWKWQGWTFDLPKGHPAAELADFAFSVKTARGVHVYFRLEEPGYNCSVKGLDIKRNGYVIGPGSIHPSGKEYKASGDFYLPVVKSLDDLLPPDWLDGLANPPEPEISIQYHTELSSDPFDTISNPIDSDKDIAEQIKQRVPIQSLFTELIPSSNGYMMTACPFHNDANPSFWIDTKKQIGNCHTCNFPKPLDSINVYAKMNSISTRDAILQLVNLV